MAQYVVYSDGINTFRDGVRNTQFVTDKAINTGTEADFSGTEGVDWINIDIIEEGS